jgi:hypothetical protein
MVYTHFREIFGETLAAEKLPPSANQRTANRPLHGKGSAADAAVHFALTMPPVRQPRQKFVLASLTDLFILYLDNAVFTHFNTAPGALYRSLYIRMIRAVALEIFPEA